MKLRDDLVQNLMSISPARPVRSRKMIQDWIQQYGLDPVDNISTEFITGFQYAVGIVEERLREEGR